jgi:hypothetical protein
VHERFVPLLEVQVVGQFATAHVRSAVPFARIDDAAATEVTVQVELVPDASERPFVVTTLSDQSLPQAPPNVTVSIGVAVYANESETDFDFGSPVAHVGK